MNKKKNQFLGSLEMKIMEIVWNLGRASVRDVLNNLKKSSRPAYTTVMTVMSRLYDKKILKRKINNDAYLYIPVHSKEEFFESASRKLINNLISELGEEVAVASFVNALEKLDVKKSKELRNKLKEIIE